MCAASIHSTEVREVDPREVIETVRTGDDSGDWVGEFAGLIEYDNKHLSELLLDIAEHGQRECIWIEPVENRVLDGHHRLLCALLLGRDVAVCYEPLK